MKFRGIYAKIIIILLLISILLTSCGPSADLDMSDEADKSEKADLTVATGVNEIWKADIYTPNFGVYRFNFCDEYIYYSVPGSIKLLDRETGEKELVPTKYYRVKIGNVEEPEELKLSGTAERNLDNALIQPDSEGNLYVLYDIQEHSIYDEDDMVGQILAKYDEAGNELYAEDISDVLATSKNTSPEITVDGEGHVYISTRRNIHLFNTDCTYKGKIDCSTSECNGLFNLAGKVYYSTISFDRILEISFDKASVCNELTSNSIGNSVTGYLDTGFISNFNGTIYYFDKDTMKAEVLTTFADCGIDDNIFEMHALDDGRIVLVTFDYKIVVLYKTQETAKKIITIGTFESSTVLQNQVAEFNRNNDDYKVEIKEYYDRFTDNTIGGTGRQDAITKFNLDIMSGNCPDILNLSYDDVSTYADKDVFEDLTPYLEASGLNIMESVEEAYTFNDVLVSIPATTQIHTLVGRSEDVENITGWTLDEMIEYIESHPDETVFAVGPNTMLQYCLKLNQSRFIDWENYECNFESEEFYRLLEFCSRFKGYDEITNTHPEVNIARSDAALYEVTMASPSDYIVLQQLLNSKDITFVGFPTDRGSGSIVEENTSSAMPTGSYGIFSQSENKDIAWEFIESLMTAVPEYETTAVRYGYPVVNETREEYFNNVMSEPWIRKSTGANSIYEALKNAGMEPWMDETVIGGKEMMRNYVTFGNVAGLYAAYFIPFEEDLAPIKELLEKGSVASDNDSKIIDIILENTAEYFAGQKTVQEAARQIQSRVTLYINERR